MSTEHKAPEPTDLIAQERVLNRSITIENLRSLITWLLEKHEFERAFVCKSSIDEITSLFAQLATAQEGKQKLVTALSAVMQEHILDVMSDEQLKEIQDNAPAPEFRQSAGVILSARSAIDAAMQSSPTLERKPND